MKSIQFLLFFTLCLLVVVNAFYDLDKIPLNSMELKDPFDGDVALDTCIYHQGRQRIYCFFEKEKYSEKGLYVMIPITKVENGPFRSDEYLSSSVVLSCNSEGKKCERGSRVATTSPWEIIEEGDSFNVKNRKIEVGVFNGEYYKEVFLHYNKVYINKLN